MILSKTGSLCLDKEEDFYTLRKALKDAVDPYFKYDLTTTASGWKEGGREGGKEGGQGEGMYIRTKKRRATTETSIPRLGPLHRPSGPPVLRKRHVPRGQEGEGQRGSLGERRKAACLDGRRRENMEGACHGVEGWGIGGKQARKGLRTEKKGGHATGGWLGVLTA